MRLFYAINLPDAIKVDLAGSLVTLGNLGRHIRPVRMDGLHATMLFLGEQPANLLPEFCRMATDAVAGAAPCEVQIGPPSFFPRVSFMTLTGETTTLAVVSNVLAQSAVKYLEKPENRPFKAHVTLARHKQNIRPGEKEKIREIFSQYEGHSWVIDELVLYESELTRSGAVYTVVERFGFGAVSVEG